MRETRTVTIKGCDRDTWEWYTEDKGAWEGPVSDWNTSHFDLYVDPVPTKGIVVTAGGNMGLYTRAYACLFERVFVFEPDAKNFQLLVANNNYPNVYFFRAGLGDQAGWANLRKSPQVDNYGMHALDQCESGDIPMMTVDQLRLPRLDLLQLDVEGGETKALMGAVESIRAYQPTVVTEGNHGDARKIFEFLGYENETSSKADYIWRPANG